jgi:hypothetical protein
MKIADQTNLGPVSVSSTPSASGPEAGKLREATPAPVTGDSADLSGLAGKISRAVSSDSSGRTAVVNQLRSEVANGTYQADAAATSRGIVNESLAYAGGSI